MARDDDDGDEDRKKLQGFDGIYFRFKGFEFAIGGTFIVTVVVLIITHGHVR